MSDRVRGVLAGEPAYRFMMADARERTADLRTEGISIGYDTSQIRAVPVHVTGLAHCNPRADIEWVQVDGTMIFTYDSSSQHTREPVSWPLSSNILVPLVIEDGVPKFDGYCPEPSMSAVRAMTP